MAAEKKIGRRSDEDDVSSADEQDTEALTLHRLNTAPQTGDERRRRQSQQQARRYQDEWAEDDDDIDDEQAFLRDADLEATAAARAFRDAEERRANMQNMDKTGRPEWLKDGIQIAKTSRRARVFLTLGLLFLLFTVFSFAFSNASDEDSKLHGVYKWAGQMWHNDGQADSGGPFDFPIDVGYPGPTQAGKVPDMADEDRATAEPTRGSSPIQTTVPEVKGFELFKHMGNLSPYTSAPDFSISTQKYRALPSSCHVERVHILHRHGSRYPTSSSPANLIRDVLRKVRATASFTGPLSFLQRYDVDRLGLELLVPLGRQQLFESGVLHETQYGRLVEADLKKHRRLFIRAGSQQRIVDSAIAFLQGMFANHWQEQTSLEIQIEAPRFNTTLAPNFACPRAGRPETEPGIQWGKDWNNKYLAAAIQRLSPHANGATLTGELLNAMQQLCSYDTVAFGRSDFCPLFTEQEWLDYEYYWDLVFYGSYGDGSEVGKAQGVGWVNEFMARLTQTPWNESTITSENSTFNNNPTTFPVDRKFYADFTHDSTIAGVLAALNLPDFNTPLPVNGPADPKRKYRASTLVPYAARTVFEEVTCDATGLRMRGKRAPSGQKQEFVRMLVNEAIVDLGQYQACQARPDGMCQRDQFIEALAKRNEWAKWSNCFNAPKS